MNTTAGICHLDFLLLVNANIVMTEFLIKPQYIALDTSHLIQWIQASLSPCKVERTEAEAFQQWLKDSGTLPLLSFHHIAELCAHVDTSVVAQRLRFLHSQTLLAWIAENFTQSSIGGVTTILAAEVDAAFRTPNSDIKSVRELASKDLIAVGTGEKLLGTDPHDWLALVPLFVEQNERAREIVAFTHTNIVENSSKTLEELMGGYRRSGESLETTLKILNGTLAHEIKKTCDRRIEDPEGLAADFVAKVRTFSSETLGDASSLVWAGLSKVNLEKSDINPKMTVGEALNLGLFYSQVKVVAEGKGLPWQEVKKRVRMESIPSWQISKIVKPLLPKTSERKGSELNDMCFLSLAPYADVTFVDKRMHQAFEQAVRTNCTIKSTCNMVTRASSYRDISQIVDKQSVSTR